MAIKIATAKDPLSGTNDFARGRRIVVKVAGTSVGQMMSVESIINEANELQEMN